MRNQRNYRCKTWYQIKVRGVLEEGWSDWLDGMEISVETDQQGGVTTLTGPVRDQAALRGLLSKLWDVNLSLISVQAM